MSRPRLARRSAAGAGEYSRSTAALIFRTRHLVGGFLLSRLTRGVVCPGKFQHPPTNSGPTHSSMNLISRMLRFALLQFLGLGALNCPTILHATDWPQWRGPNRDGIS